ncbi:ABC transporter permease [Flavitalea flava]
MLKNYLLIAFRNFRKNKVFSFINILSLTLGLACSLALFMIVRYELSFDGFHQKGGRIFRVVSDFRYPEGVEYQCGVPYPLPQAFKNDFPQLEKVVSIMGSRNTQITIPPQQQGAVPARFLEKNGLFYTEPAFFDLFDFTWLSGSPANVLSQPNTIALTRKTAEKYFGSWENAIGKTIMTDDPYILTVKGILENPPPNTDFPMTGVISFGTIEGRLKGKGWGTVSSQFQCYILLPQHLAVSQVNRLLPAFQKKNRGNQTDFFSLQPLPDIHFNGNYGNFGDRTANKKTLWALSLIGIFLLALGCINFINLATAQAVTRSREVGIRKVLGSQRWQLALQFLGETGLLVGMSVILAIGLVTSLSPFAGQLINGSMPLQPLHSTGALQFMFLTAIIVTLVSGAYPAIVLSGFRPITALKNKMATSGNPKGIFLRRVLVVSQFAIAQTLIVGVLVAISQMNFFRSAPLGFNKEAIVTVSLPDDSSSQTKWESFRQQLLQQSGVEKVSLSYSPPSGRGTNLSTFRYNQDTRDDNFELNLKLADSAYLNTYGLSLVAGRFYLPSDTIREWVVNETFLKSSGKVAIS